MRSRNRHSYRPSQLSASHLGAIASVLLGLALACTIACSDQGGNERRRVLLIGIDAASPRIVDLLEPFSGLPNLQGIAKEGAYVPLRSMIPLVSPRVWNTIATGKDPTKHGILSFVRPDRHLYRSSDRKVHALWNILSSHGFSTAVVNWWNTYPPEMVAGVMVSDHFLATEVEARKRFHKAEEDDEAAPVVFPPSWESRLAEIRANTPPLAPYPNFFEGLSGLPRWIPKKQLAARFDEDDLVTRIALAIDQDLSPDVTMVFLAGIDRISHWLWGSIEPQILLDEKHRFKPRQRLIAEQALFAYYRYTDYLIGRLVERFDSDDLVMIVSDHGFEVGATKLGTTGRHDTTAAQDGVLFVRGKGVRPPTPEESSPGAVSVSDIAPTILAWLGLPVANDMDGKAAGFIAQESAPRIATYDDTPIERVGGGEIGAEEELKERLRGLGYIE